MSTGHAFVREQIVGKLADQLPIRLDDRKPRLIASGDQLPDRDEHWPCVLVQTTRATRAIAQEVMPDEMVFIYDAQVTVATRGATRQADAVAEHRDDLLLSVRHSLISSPGLEDGRGQVILSRLSEETGAVSNDSKERYAAAGSIAFQVQVVESIEPAVDVVETPIEATVSVTASDAATQLLLPFEETPS